MDIDFTTQEPLKPKFYTSWKRGNFFFDFLGRRGERCKKKKWERKKGKKKLFKKVDKK